MHRSGLQPSFKALKRNWMHHNAEVKLCSESLDGIFVCPAVGTLGQAA